MIERAALEYVANSVWQVPLLAATTWLAIRAGRPEPCVQHRMWVGTLTLAVVLPLVQPSTFHLHLAQNAQNQFFAPSHGVSVDASFLYQPMTQNGNIAQAETTAAQSRDAAVGPHPAKSGSTEFPHSVRLSPGAADWLIGIYFAIVLLRLVQLARSRQAAGRLLRRAKERMLSPLESAVLEKCCEKMHLSAPRVLFSREARTPMAIGSNRPAVLLPESFHGCAEAEMKAILCHELAHVRRGDYVANWICQLGSLPIAYHPATYWIDREIRRSRELACDAIAAEAMDSSVEYAGCLVGVARRIEIEGVANRAAAPGSPAAPGLFDHDVFEERIMNLLERKSGSVRTSVWRMTGAFALIVGAAVGAAALHITPVVRANAMTIAADQAAVSAQPTPATVRNRARIAKVVRVSKHTRVRMHAAVAVKIRVPLRAKVRVHAFGPIAELAEPLRPVVAMQGVPPEKPAPPTPPSLPKDEPMPPAPSKPATPASPITPQQPASIKPPAAMQPEPDSLVGGVTFKLTPEQRERVDRDLAAANARIQEQTKVLNSPEFKAQMAQMRRQIEAATKNLRSAEFQAQIKALQSPEFKKQMADMRLQMRQATRQLRSAEIQAQIKYFQSPEFKKQMEDMQRQVQEATKQMQNAQFQAQMKYLQSPEFKKRMEDMQRQTQEATKNLEMNRMQLDMKQMPKRETPAAPSERDNSVPQ